MSNEYVFLTEKDAMWAEALMQVLRNNGIPCTALPVHGVGMVMRGGAREQLKIYVPAAGLEHARELMEVLFSPEEILKDSEE